MNALEFHKMFLEQINSVRNFRPTVVKTAAPLSPIPEIKPEFQVPILNESHSDFPWGKLIFGCATIGLIIYLYDRYQNQNSTPHIIKFGRRFSRHNNNSNSLNFIFNLFLLIRLILTIGVIKKLKVHLSQ